jgi:drug/metabolite transporter (DMT)-like permease
MVLLPLAVLDWRPPTSGRTWLFLLAVGVAQLLSQAFIVFGYRYASAVQLSPIVYSVIVFSAVIDWVSWGQPPTLAVVAGMTLVIGGGLLAILVRPRAAARHPGATRATRRPCALPPQSQPSSHTWPGRGGEPDNR